MKTYEVIRFFQDRGKDAEVVKTGLTLKEAQAHCNDPETSSRTCTLPERRAITDRHGPWFDGYQEE